jgi:hypothetical protein
MTRRILAALLLLFWASAMGQPAFEAGQVWRYKTRPGEDNSRLYITRIDPWSKGERIIHVYIDKIKIIDNPALDWNVQRDLSHIPITEQALKESVTRLAYTMDKPPNLSQEYYVWKQQQDEGWGFTRWNIPVNKIITQITDTEPTDRGYGVVPAPTGRGYGVPDDK